MLLLLLLLLPPPPPQLLLPLLQRCALLKLRISIGRGVGGL
jgi:hypothetical protein